MTHALTIHPRDYRHPDRPARPDNWRCTNCSRLLGRIRSGQLHVRFSRGHEYMAMLPATCTCRGCGTLNSLRRQ